MGITGAIAVTTGATGAMIAVTTGATGTVIAVTTGAIGAMIVVTTGATAATVDVIAAMAGALGAAMLPTVCAANVMTDVPVDTTPVIVEEAPTATLDVEATTVPTTPGVGMLAKAGTGVRPGPTAWRVAFAECVCSSSLTSVAATTLEIFGASVRTEGVVGGTPSTAME